MDQKNIFSLMKNPSSYTHPVSSVQQIQTHISSVFLTGKFVYKIKKKVDFGFLDFSTLEKRKHFCDEELLLNNRLSPGLYLDVVPISETKDNKIIVDSSDNIIEYAVKMKQFPQEKIMVEQLKKNNVRKYHIDQIIKTLTGFYENQEITDEIRSYGKKIKIEQNIIENFQQTESFIDRTIPESQYKKIQSYNQLFLDESDEMFLQRMKHDCIKPCHGDLHSGNIVIWDDRINIFDCIEFNKRFQYIDIVSDIGFLAMDLDVQNHPFLSSYFIDKYMENNHDSTLLNLLNFYKSYRAYVRGKVQGFQLNDDHIPQKQKDKIIKHTHIYFSLSEYYISLSYLQLKKKRPIIFLVGGLTGTGKSTLAQKLSIDYNGRVINTDIVRKQLEGIKPYERHHDKPDTGLYKTKKREKVYEKVLEIASEKLSNDQNVIIDATFQKRKHRKAVEDLSHKYHANLIMINCVNTDEQVKEFLEHRMKTNSISDGRWEIYLSQKKTFEPFEEHENAIEYDMSEKDFEKRFNMFQNILNRIYELEEL